LLQPGRPQATAADAFGEAQQEAGRAGALAPERDVAPGRGARGGEPEVAFGRRRAQDGEDALATPGGLQGPRLPAGDEQLGPVAEQDSRAAVAVRVVRRQPPGVGQLRQPPAGPRVEGDEVLLAVAVLVLDRGQDQVAARALQVVDQSRTGGGDRDAALVLVL